MCDNIATHAVIHWNQRADYACREHTIKMCETEEDIVMPLEKPTEKTCNHEAWSALPASEKGQNG